MKRSQKTFAERVRKEKFVRQEVFDIKPLNDNQKLLLESLGTSSVVIASGCAGTGKTLLACYHAAKQLREGRTSKIVLIRAYQPLAGRSIGFLPGTLEEKLMPYYQQLIDYFEDFLGKAAVEIYLKQKDIEIVSLETIRGRNWDNAIVIVDEAQNLFIPEVKALVTRIGNYSQMIFCGDNKQTDVNKGMTGLAYLQELVYRYLIPDTSFVEFGVEDIVRSGITKEFVIAFEKELQADRPII